MLQTLIQSWCWQWSFESLPYSIPCLKVKNKLLALIIWEQFFPSLTSKWNSWWHDHLGTIPSLSLTSKWNELVAIIFWEQFLPCSTPQSEIHCWPWSFGNNSFYVPHLKVKHSDGPDPLGTIPSCSLPSKWNTLLAMILWEPFLLCLLPQSGTHWWPWSSGNHSFLVLVLNFKFVSKLKCY